MTNFQANVPLINVPFVDKNGNVTEAWFIFLIQLWRRTGGNATAPSNLTIADVLALEQTVAPQLFGVEAGALADIVYPQLSPESSIADIVFPAQQPDILDQTFSSGSDFTPGTTVTLTLSTSFQSAARLWVFFDAAFQGDDQYSLTGTALTFTSAIPVGTNKVYVKGLM